MSCDNPLPEPLVPAEVNLQTLPSMLLDVARFRDSSYAAEVDPASGFFGVILWSAAWHQEPAGSLPSSPVQLAKLAGLGRDQASWERYRDGALRGWVLCSDGRLYHPVVCMKALEQWASRVAMKLKSGAGNKSRYGTPFDKDAVTAQLARAQDAMRRLFDMGVKPTKDVPSQGVLPLGIPDAMPSGSADASAQAADTAAEASLAASPVGSEVKGSEVKSTEDKPSPTPPEKPRRGRGRERLGEAEFSRGFLAFWDAYPKKVGKSTAWAAWKRDRLDEFALTITTNVEDRKARDGRWLRNDGQFIPDPTTYLNQERWNDEFEAPRSSNQRQEVERENTNVAGEWAGRR